MVEQRSKFSPPIYHPVCPKICEEYHHPTTTLSTKYLKIPQDARVWCEGLFEEHEQVSPEILEALVCKSAKCVHGGAMYRYPARWSALLPGTMECRWQKQGGMDWGVLPHPPQTPEQVPSVDEGPDAAEIWVKCKELLKINAVEIVDPEKDKPVYWKGVQIHQFLSRTFLIPKPHQPNESRMLVGMKESGLNAVLTCEVFKQEGISDVKEISKPGDYAIKLDLKNAYYQTLVIPQLRRQLRTKVLDVDRNLLVVLQYRGGSQGAKPIPEKFTKQLRGLQRQFRALGIRLVIKIDDVLILAQSPEQCLLHTYIVIRVTAYLGCVWKLEKCSFIPSHRIGFHGAMFCFTVQMCWTPADKCYRAALLTEQLIELLQSPEDTMVSLRLIAKVKGTWMAMIEMVNEIRLLMTELADLQLAMMQTQTFKKRGWGTQLMKSELDHAQVASVVMELKQLARPSEKVLAQEIPASSYAWNGRLFGRTTILATLWTDACDYQWGLVLIIKSVRVLEVAYPFSAKEVQEWHITKKETAGLVRGLEIVLRMFPQIRDGTISCKTDATTTKAYLKKAGGRLTHLNLLIWNVIRKVIQKQVMLKVEHVAGLKNISDAPSRLVLGLEEFSLNPLIFSKLELMWGAPQVDLFAAQWNNKCPVYASKHAWDLGATHVDAMSLDWAELPAPLYAHPPVHKRLILSMVRKVQKEQVQQIYLVVPLWKQQWLAEALQMTVTLPILLQCRSELLLPPEAYTLVQELQHRDWSTPSMWKWYVVLNMSGGHYTGVDIRPRWRTAFNLSTSKSQVVAQAATIIANIGVDFGCISGKQLEVAAGSLSATWLSAIVRDN
jgi:hypothetical protein